VERIQREGDPRVAEYARLGDPEWLQSRGLFVAEGRLVVRRVLADARSRVRSLLVNDAAHRDLAPALEAARCDPPVYVCETGAFRDITGFDIHRGCLALVERPAPRTSADVAANARVIVVLEDVANPDNIGGVFRNAAALGGGAVILSPSCADPLYRKAIRTSMAATLRVPFARADEWPADLLRLRDDGFTIAVLTPHPAAQRLDEFAALACPRIALVAGNEGAGLSAAVESAADYRVRIPIDDGVDSLNVAVAVGIALYALRA